jgi:SAM-dependent methyltransferase
MQASRRTYLPAAGRQWGLALDDPITRLLGIDSTRRALLARAALRPGQRILDLGCGTGRFVVQLKLDHPTVDVVGTDPDPAALARARRQAAISTAPSSMRRRGDFMPPSSCSRCCSCRFWLTAPIDGVRERCSAGPLWPFSWFSHLSFRWG